MKKLGIFFLCLYCCLSISAQNNLVKIKEDIEDGMKSFASELDYICSENETERRDIGSVNRFMGGEYFTYNKSPYQNLGDWLGRFYMNQLKKGEVNHVISVDRKTVKRLGTVKDGHCYQFEAILTRESATGEDVVIPDEKLVVDVEVNRGSVRVLGIKGDMTIKRFTPEYRWNYELKVTGVPDVIDEYGGHYTAEVVSVAHLIKSYGDFKRDTIEIAEVPVYYLGDKDKEDKVEKGSYNIKFPRNYSEYSKDYIIQFRQELIAKGKDFYVSQGNFSQTFKKEVTQEGTEKTWWEKFIEIDDYVAPYWDVNIHYGLKTTFGLSFMGRFEDTRFTLGFLTAMCKDRMSQLWRWSYTWDYTILGTTTNLGTTVIVDQNGADVTVEKYSEKATDIIYPSKRGYSSEIDPDGEAKHKKVYSYNMLTAGMFVNNWWHLDLGLGVARTQDTYNMGDAYMIKVMERTYTLNGVTTTDTERRLERTGVSFLYKDKAKYHFAMRPAMNFYIPVSSDEIYLKVGAGYTYVPTDTDANNLDFTLGVGFNF